MLISLIYKVIVAACLFGASGASANAEFKQIQNTVFGNLKAGYLYYTASHIENLIHRMIELIEAGAIPPSVQGIYDLEYLKSLEDDCTVEDECNIERDVPRLRRLNRRERKQPNFNDYLSLCRIRLQTRCSDEVYKIVKASLKLDQKTKDILDALTYELRLANGSNQFIYLFHPSVLKTLKKIDPEASKKVVKKWTQKEKALRELMNTIHLSCSTFLGSMNELVELWPAQHSGYESEDAHTVLSKWHYTTEACKQILNQWDSIVKESKKDCGLYLIDPKPHKGRYHFADGGGKGVSTSTLFDMAGAG